MIKVLILVALTAATTNDAAYTDDEIKNIGRQLENAFQDFPNQGAAQFAVMVFISPTDFENGNTDVVNMLHPDPRVGDNIIRQPAVYVQPNIDLAENYLVAKPNRRRKFNGHAEYQLLHKLKFLWNNYIMHYDYPPRMVLIHTHFTPCPSCTHEIAGILYGVGEWVQNPQMVDFAVTYAEDTDTPGYMSIPKNEANRQLLEKGGVRVLQIP